eukprot:61106_1
MFPFSPSNWKRNTILYYPTTPSSPSSSSMGEEEERMNSLDLNTCSKETKECFKNERPSCACDELLSVLPWINKKDIPCDESLAVYNKRTGGKCYEMEQEAIHKTAHQNRINSQFECYLKHIEKNIFYLNAAGIYETILIYLDATSILQGLMMTCKKWHYLRFIHPKESQIWNRLLFRDFPKLSYTILYVPYMDSNSFENDILTRREENVLYFTKVKHDTFWSLIHYIKLDPNCDYNQIKSKWRHFTWSELLIGPCDDSDGLNAYKALNKLRHHPYFMAFDGVELPDDDVIDYFCNAVRRYMPTGRAIVYLNPWISPRRIVHWKRNKTNRETLWLNEYGQCWAEPYCDGYGMKQIPPLVQLIGSVQFQNGKSFTPEPDWLPFLQSFDPTLTHIEQVPKDAWFQKQFLLIEMENRLKNIRALIEIVRD